MRWWIGTLLALAACVLPQSASAEGRWVRAESSRFIVYGEGGPDEARDATRELESLDFLLRRMSATTAPPSPVQLEVYLLGKRFRLRQVWPSAPADVAGFYASQPDLIAAFGAYTDPDYPGDLDGRMVLYHEYAHHFMLQYFNNAYPGWYVEGFAEYIATARFLPDRIEVGRVPQIRADWLSGGSWLPIEKILRGLDGRATGDDVAKFYAQSWLAVHYLINMPDRMRGFRAYMVALRGGGDPVTAFEPAFGITPEAFDAELRRYKRGRLNAFALTNPAATTGQAITVTRLPPSADTLLLLDARLRRSPQDSEKAAALAATVEAAAAYPTDPFARRTLARAHIEAGDPANALPVLDALLAATPDDAQALYLKGSALLAMSERDDAHAPTLRAQAKSLLGRSNRLAPDNPHTLFRYAIAASDDANATDENQLNVLLLAEQLAPQVSTYRLNAASALMSRDRYDEAAAMLRPLAFSPHDSGTSKLAKVMMEAAMRHEPYVAPESKPAE